MKAEEKSNLSAWHSFETMGTRLSKSENVRTWFSFEEEKKTNEKVVDQSKSCVFLAFFNFFFFNFFDQIIIPEESAA